MYKTSRPFLPSGRFQLLDAIFIDGVHHGQDLEVRQLQDAIIINGVHHVHDPRPSLRKHSRKGAEETAALPSPVM